MRLIVQRVSCASVKAQGKTVGRIDKGLFVLVGINQEDREKEARDLAQKLAKLRIMADEKNKMNLSVRDTNAKSWLFPSSPFMLILIKAIGRLLLKPQSQKKQKSFIIYLLTV